MRLWNISNDCAEGSRLPASVPEASIAGRHHVGPTGARYARGVAREPDTPCVVWRKWKAPARSQSPSALASLPRRRKTRTPPRSWMPPTKPFTAPKAMDETAWRQHLHRVVAFAPRLLASRELNLESKEKCGGLRRTRSCCQKRVRTQASSPPPELGAFRSMQHAERVAAVGTNQDQSILTLRHFAQLLLNIGRGFDFVTVHFEDHITALQSGVVGRAARLHLLNQCSVNLAGRLNLLSQVGSEIAQPDAPAHLSLTVLRVLFARSRAVAHCLERYRKAQAFSVPQNIKRDFRARTFL